MSRATIDLIRGDMEAAEIADELDQLYCYEQVVVHWCRAVESRLTGLATFVLPDELAKVVNAASATGERLAARIAQLGGEITADPSDFVARAPIDQFVLPPDTSDLPAILGVALQYERRLIARYGKLVDRLRDADAITHRLLAELLADKLAREDEIEAVLAPAQR